MKSWTHTAIAAMTVFLFSHSTTAQRQMEKLNRGLVAIPSGAGYFLTWRLLGTEPAAVAFNLYKGTTKLNASPLSAVTSYQDNSAGTGVYTIKPVLNGAEQAASEAARVLTANYFSIPLQIPPGGSGYTFSANDASLGDMDGDGEYEIVLKWDPSNSKDNSQSGSTGPQILDAYKLNGTRLWRINLGPNIRAGAHYTQFMVYDFDGDGKAEVMCKTGDGTVDGTGAILGSATARWANSNGYVVTGPEFLTVFDGMTGKALKTVDYVPARGALSGWGGVGGNGSNDSIGNRVDRFLAGVAYLDGVRPSAVFCRGYYGKSVLAAWDWRNGQLTQRWVFNSSAWDSIQPAGTKLFSGQGAHSLSVADVDGDGKDEIIYGAMTVDDNGTGLYSTGFRHGDALYVGDLDPARPGLEVYMIHENEAAATSSPGSELHNAGTGQVYWSTAVGADVGRGVAADIDPNRLGAEFWGTGNVRDVNGAAISGLSPGSTNFAAWWDGDLGRELEDGTSITKVGGGTLLTATDCASNNGSKSTPAVSADFWGDWREEVIWRTSDNTALRIYTTTTPTTYRFYTLMHNPEYRLAIAWQNVAYNQPPNVDYYLGTGMTVQPPPPNIITTTPTGIFSGRARAGRKASFHALKILGGRQVVLPAGFAETDRILPIYNLAGKRLLEVAAHHGVLEFPKGFAQPNQVYIVGDGKSIEPANPR